MKPNSWDYFSDDHEVREAYWRYWCGQHARSASSWATACGCAVAVAFILALYALETWCKA